MKMIIRNNTTGKDGRLYTKGNVRLRRTVADFILGRNNVDTIIINFCSEYKTARRKFRSADGGRARNSHNDSGVVFAR